MNERAREVLVQAALDGVRQIKGTYHDGRDGFCALGVLLRASNQMLFWRDFWHLAPNAICTLKATYEIDDLNEIADANDRDGWDFLTIARKCGLKEQENHG